MAYGPRDTYVIEGFEAFNYANKNCGIDVETPLLASDITIDTVNRVVTITKNFTYYLDGTGTVHKHEIVAPVSFPAFTNTSGMWFFYFNNDKEPISTQSLWTDFNTVCPILRLTWNATDGEILSLFYECHKNDISAIDHLWKHQIGAQYHTGFNIYSSVTSGVPNADGRNTCISLSSGGAMDDNLLYFVLNSTNNAIWNQDMGALANITTSNAGIFNIRYKGATEGALAQGTRFPFLWDSDTNRPQYINSSGVRTLVSNNYYFTYFVYSIQDWRKGNPVRLTPAYAEYQTLQAVQAVTWETVQIQDPAAQDPEIRPLYKLIFQYVQTYDAGIKYTALRQVNDIRKMITARSNIELG